jgi:hypothetical protein
LSARAFFRYSSTAAFAMGGGIWGIVT